jgi:hypothetical protein
MSGGSLNYVYARVDEAADEIRSRARCPEHRAFAAHLDLVSAALKDIEWMFSCDTGPGDELPAIRKVVTPEMVLRQTVAEAERVSAEMLAALAAARAWYDEHGCAE